MSIYIVTHRPYEFPAENFYKPIQVGVKFSDKLLCDSSGLNISKKNKNYCELTALYWLWKNAKDDVIGLVHYRRYFIGTTNDYKFKNLNIVTKSHIESLLTNYDVIAPCLLSLNESLFIDWSRYHNIIDWLNVGKIIHQLYPEYMASFLYVSQSKEMHAYNMFIMKSELMSEYCAWLFKILFEYENKVCLSSLNDYQSRLFGFLSERLFNVWLHHNQLRIFEIDVINMETVDSNSTKRSATKRFLSNLRYIIKRDIKAYYLFYKFKKNLAI